MRCAEGLRALTDPRPGCAAVPCPGAYLPFGDIRAAVIRGRGGFEALARPTLPTKYGHPPQERELQPRRIAPADLLPSRPMRVCFLTSLITVLASSAFAQPPVTNRSSAPAETDLATPTGHEV